MSIQETVISKETYAGFVTRPEIIDIYKKSQWIQDNALGDT